ncbi:MAG: phosphate ABC transporter ATP-binding protein [Oligoflexales bacterium]|nr:phosphate ABC transporter ATP-binding protein [Oligoflexales bacterium]
MTEISFSSSNAESIIDIRNLKVFFKDKKAVDDISLTIPKNKVTAIIGPSGCGKSTVLRSLNRMHDFVDIARAEGQILYKNFDILSPKTDPVRLRREIGMVFQKPNPFPKTIYQNIVWGPRINGYKGNEDELVERSLHQAALWSEVKDRLFDSALGLSGGQQQRLCIARTIAMKPKIILMDEPCSALDPKSTSHIEDLILDLKKDYTIIIVTHNMQQASRISEYTAFFYEGRLVEYDLTSKIFTNPTNKQTEDYISGRFG